MLGGALVSLVGLLATAYYQCDVVSCELCLITFCQGSGTVQEPPEPGLCQRCDLIDFDEDFRLRMNPLGKPIASHCTSQASWNARMTSDMCGRLQGPQGSFT